MRFACLALLSWWFYSASIDDLLQPLRGIEFEVHGPIATLSECEGHAEMLERMTRYAKIVIRIQNTLIPACLPGERPPFTTTAPTRVFHRLITGP